MNGLTCDLYSLTMAQGYWHYRHNPPVVFDFFFRSPPFRGGFVIFAGLETFLRELSSFRFDDEDIAYLKSLAIFSDKFLSFLSGFSFRGTVYSVDEGEVIFAQEPVLRIHAHLIEAQLIEAFLLNIVNFQSLIATKTARMYLASNGGTIAEFGLRRAQGPNGALLASRACYIGGASSTSHVMAGRVFNIPVHGTMAHSWVTAFKNEDDAFEKYAALYPSATFLLDTYNTLGSGIEAAIKVGKRLHARGLKWGVRLDSGDIHYLSVRVRERLDNAGLTDATIVVSNELNEEIIRQLVSSKAPIDVWGIGTTMVTGSPDASLSGVYKMAAKKRGEHYAPVMKLSDNPQKSNNPGIKQIYRFYGHESPGADLIALESEKVQAGEPRIFYHPYMDWRHFLHHPSDKVVPLLKRYMHNGEVCVPLPSLPHIRDTTLHNLLLFDDSYLRIINPHIYKVSISEELRNCKQQFIPATKKV